MTSITSEGKPHVRAGPTGRVRGGLLRYKDRQVALVQGALWYCGHLLPLLRTAVSRRARPASPKSHWRTNRLTYPIQGLGQDQRERRQLVLRKRIWDRERHLARWSHQHCVSPLPCCMHFRLQEKG